MLSLVFRLIDVACKSVGCAINSGGANDASNFGANVAKIYRASVSFTIVDITSNHRLMDS